MDHKRQSPRDTNGAINGSVILALSVIVPVIMFMFLSPTRPQDRDVTTVLYLVPILWLGIPLVGRWAAERARLRREIPHLLTFKPPWWPLITRGVVLLGGALLLLKLILDRYPLMVQVAGKSYSLLWLVLTALFLALWALMSASLLRYHRFRRDNPLEYLNIDLAETEVGISESRVALCPWSSIEIVSCNLSAEGMRAGGAGLVLKVMYRMPWLRRAGFQAVARAAVTNEHIVARFDASSEDVYPEEAREGLDVFLKSSRAALSTHPGWMIVVTPGDLLLWLPDSPRPTEVARIADRIASDWAHVERPRPAGYRDVQPPTATPNEIARIDRLADELWSALPEVPSGRADGGSR